MIYHNSRTEQAAKCQTFSTSDSLIQKSINAEEQFLSTMWLYPAKGVEAAGRSGLTQTSFTSCRHAFIFVLIEECELLGLEANLDHVEQLAPIEAAFDAGDVRQLVYPDRFIFIADLDSLAETVVEFSRQRQEVGEHWRRMLYLAGNDLREFINAL